MEYEINKEFIEFYCTYFNDINKTNDLLHRCYDVGEVSLIPRRLVNQLARSILFADYSYHHKLGNRSFQIFMWMAMIESFEYTINPNIESEQVEKLGIILNFFRNNLNTDDKEHLVKHLQRSVADERFDNVELPIDSISRIFYAIRNEFAHGLNFHTSLFAAESNDDNFLETIKLKEFRKDTKDKRTFEMSITYEQLRDIIIRTSINQIEYQLKLISEG